MDPKLNEIKVDCSLAEEYLIREEKIKHFLKTGRKRQYSSSPDKDDDDNSHKSSESSSESSIDTKLLKLAEKLKENMNLFTQLEYLMRKIPIEDTISQINIIIQQIHFVTNNFRKEEFEANRCEGESGFDLARRIDFWSSDTPFLLFGVIPKVLVNFESAYFYTRKTTVAICNLFANLCKEVGLPVTMRFAIEEVQWPIDREECELHVRIPVGAVGVVSELSDIDSALNSFLNASVHAPWKLQKVFVQQNSYKNFLAGLKSKCDLNKQEDASNSRVQVDNSLKCSGKEFLIDNIASGEPQPSQVYVSAYRTREELLSLLNEHRPHYLSLWANDVAEINEVAHNVHSPVVWLNNYADFRGPPAVTEAIFSFVLWGPQFQMSGEEVNLEHLDTDGELCTLRRDWQKLDFKVRRNKLLAVLDNYMSALRSKKNLSLCDDGNAEEQLKAYTKIKEELNKTEFGGFKHVDEDYVCEFIPGPSRQCFAYIHQKYAIYEMFKSLLYGNAISMVASGCYYEDEDEDEHIIKTLMKANLPVAVYDTYESEDDVLTFVCRFEGNPLRHLCDLTTRVIWTKHSR